MKLNMHGSSHNALNMLRNFEISISSLAAEFFSILMEVKTKSSELTYVKRPPQQDDQLRNPV
jgi:hypothetical protein